MNRHGTQLLYYLLVVTTPLHSVVLMSEFWLQSEGLFWIWEFCGVLYGLFSLISWKYLSLVGRGRLIYLPVTLCLARWQYAWFFAQPSETFTSTISVLLYLPLLVGVAILLGHSKTKLSIVGVILSLSCLVGSQREGLADTVLSDWRAGPAMLCAFGLLALYFHIWQTNFRSLQDVRARERDLTIRLQASTTKQLSKRMEAVYRLSGTLSHEYNNIFTIILPLSEGLIEEIDHPSHRNDLTHIIDACYRAKTLSRQLLKLTKTEGVVEHRLDLIEHVKEAVDQLSGTYEHPIIFKLPAEECLISSYPNEIFNLLKLLVDNAVEASPSLTPIEIELTLLENGEGIKHTEQFQRGPVARLVVKDQGNGIPEELSSTIFEPFVTTSQEVGRGLGLSIVFTIVVRLGGVIDVESRKGEGTSVRIHLPVITEYGVTSESTPMSDKLSPEQLRGMRVLLVDDEHSLIHSIKRAMVRVGMDVVTCHDPREAVQLMLEEENTFDLIISDIRMPHLSGPEWIAQVKEHMTLPPYLFITGHIDDTLAKSLNIDEQQVLFKPFSPSKLLQRIIGLCAEPKV